ncbi:hypothetical protein Vau01_111680 [Virgisporangium aurantiacum]|uniref:Uncharacterized protein n=1 Tax=Virgisporangium aurantiacum TaxID=175570 RepID=A0A8J3ZIP0_9ACTN|nr:hypothetical protein Vau01_111680 [Virgisporangium aurantiacum]
MRLGVSTRRLREVPASPALNPAGGAHRGRGVAISTGVRRLTVPGFNEDVLWLGGRIVAHQEGRTYVIAADGRTAVPLDGAHWDEMPSDAVSDCPLRILTGHSQSTYSIGTRS